MHVFVTGAAGFIGRAVVHDLLSHGHTVLGLARSDASAEAITKAGAEAHRGDLKDLESLRSGANTTEGVIHLAFGNNFSDFPGITAMDGAAIQAMGDAMAGTGKPLVIASGTLIAQKGQLATEDTAPDREPPFSFRAQSEDVVTSLSKEKQVRGVVIRLPPTVHGVEDKGLIPMAIDQARKSGSAMYVDDGSARCPAVHRLDTAVLFRLALEKGRAGAVYNAVADQGVPMKDIMGLVGKQLQLPAEGGSMSKVTEALGFIANLVATDNPTSSERTQRELGWTPVQPGLLADIEANYFL